MVLSYEDVLFIFLKCLWIFVLRIFFYNVDSFFWAIERERWLTTQVGTFLFFMSVRTRKHAKFLNVPNGGVLFRQGDPAKGCYIVVSGKVGFYAGGNSNTPRQPPTEMNETIPEAARRVKTYEGVKWMIVRCQTGFLHLEYLQKKNGGIIANFDTWQACHYFEVQFDGS